MKSKPRYFRIDHEGEAVPGYVKISGPTDEVIEALRSAYISAEFVEITREDARKLQAKIRRAEAKKYEQTATIGKVLEVIA